MQEKARTESPGDTTDFMLVTVSVPLKGFTPRATANLIRSVYARQDLIAAMTGQTTIRVDLDTMIRLDNAMPVSAAWIERIIREETEVGRVTGVSLKGGEFALTFQSRDAERTRALCFLTSQMVNRARNARYVRSARIQPPRGRLKAACKMWLEQLGMYAEGFKSTRLNLLHGVQA